MSDPLDRKFSVHASDIVATVTCHCRLGNQPILIMSASVEAVCAHCGQRFVIMEAAYKQGDPMSVIVGMMPAHQPVNREGTVARFPARG